jgi:putative hydrolase of HD superfamily
VIRKLKHENSLGENNISNIMILDFFKTAINLKNISRQGWIDKLSLKHPESVADHSYSMAIMGMLISDLENYDSEKILKMILLHDLAESKIGDYTPDEIDKDEKVRIENNSFFEITKKLPTIIKSQYDELLKEYQNHTTPESQIVHQIDKLEMALQAKTYQKEGIPKEKIESFLEYARISITHPKLKELFNLIQQD